MSPTEWDAATYDRASGPQQSWAVDVLERVGALPEDAVLLDVGCGTGRVTERLAELYPGRTVYAVDASHEMVEQAARRLGDRAEVWQADALEVSTPRPVDVVVSTATLHWVADHDRLWRRLFSVLAPGGRLVAQCGGAGNIARVRVAIDAAAREIAPELVGWSPWTFASAEQTARRLREGEWQEISCWLVDMPTEPDDVAGFVESSILPAHLARLAPERRAPFAAAVLERTAVPLDYVRLNVLARRPGGPAPS